MAEHRKSQFSLSPERILPAPGLCREQAPRTVGQTWLAVLPVGDHAAGDFNPSRGAAVSAAVFRRCPLEGNLVSKRDGLRAKGIIG